MIRCLTDPKKNLCICSGESTSLHESFYYGFLYMINIFRNQFQNFVDFLIVFDQIFCEYSHSYLTHVVVSVRHLITY